MKRRQILFLCLGLAGIFALAFLLRGAVKSLVILPLAKLFWYIKGYYGVFPQAAYWVIVLGIAVLIALATIPIGIESRRSRKDQGVDLLGPVENLAFWLERSRSGIFPKWHIARILAEVALQLLERREPGEKPPSRLSASGWNPPDSVRRYLDAALKTTYTNYPRSHRSGRQSATPFDQDVEPVVEHLESLLESENDHHS
jgi:hypothetical protein